MIGSSTLSPELSALSPDPELRPKTFAHGPGLKTFLGKCRLGDKGDKSDSNKYSGALTEGFMLDKICQSYPNSPR